jgi:tetratricopeptide (TPR) repeat protein
VREHNVIPVQVLAEAGTTDPVELTRLGIEAAEQERWKAALVLLGEAYRLFSIDPELQEGMIKVETDSDEPIARKTAEVRMFSYYGLALAMSNNSRAEEGARFCEIAIQKEPYHAEHYLALARIWQAARNRQKTVQAVDRGLRELPRSQSLLEMRGAIGWREKSAVSFLPRGHPVNVTLGKMLRKKRDPSSGPPRPKR